jgi:glycosyltransferase involved in cell wall biosynthesis
MRARCCAASSGAGSAGATCIAATLLAISAERSIRILIVTYAFPPLNAIASHRPYSWAKTWRDLGHEIEVLTFAKHAFDGALDLERDVAGMRVHEVSYVPASSTTSRGGVARWERIKTLTRRTRFKLGIFGDPRWFAYLPMLREATRLAAGRRFDLIVATAPPEITFMVARALARRTRTPWVADFRDLWFRDMTLYRSRLAAWLSGPLNRWLVAPAAALSTVSRGLQERLAGYLGREVTVSYNGFFKDDAAAATAVADGRRHIVYTGRLYPGKRDPEPLFRALASLPDVRQRLRIDFYGHDDPWLRGLVERHGVQDCVTMHGFVAYRESIAVQRSADVLLFLDWMDVSAEGVLTGKLFEYLGSGRPILALGPRRDSEAAGLIAETGAGVTLTSEPEIAQYLKQVISSERPQDVPPAAVERFSRERQAGELLVALKQRLRA